MESIFNSLSKNRGCKYNSIKSRFPSAHVSFDKYSSCRENLSSNDLRHKLESAIQKEKWKCDSWSKRELKKKKTYLPVVTDGCMFGNLNLIPTDPRIDPRPNYCFNCWQPGHIQSECTRPVVAVYCYNCGRRDISLYNCPRCGDAFKAKTKKSYGNLQENHELQNVADNSKTDLSKKESFKGTVNKYEKQMEKQIREDEQHSLENVDLSHQNVIYQQLIRVRQDLYEEKDKADKFRSNELVNPYKKSQNNYNSCRLNRDLSRNEYRLKQSSDSSDHIKDQRKLSSPRPNIKNGEKSHWVIKCKSRRSSDCESFRKQQRRDMSYSDRIDKRYRSPRSNLSSPSKTSYYQKKNYAKECIKGKDKAARVREAIRLIEELHGLPKDIQEMVLKAVYQS